MVFALNVVRNGLRRSRFSIAIAAAFFVLSSIPTNATSILSDGTFQNSIGTGLNLTPWSDWTNAGVSRSAAPNGIPGNSASLPVGADLFQRFSGPNPGNYWLSFFVQNLAARPAELVFSVQAPGGDEWYEYLGVIDLPPSSGFLYQSFFVQLTKPEGSPSEFYFSNSYDSITGGAADYFYPMLANSKNPVGTIIDVANVSLSDLPMPVPLPSTLSFFVAGIGCLGLLLRQKKRSKVV